MASKRAPPIQISSTFSAKLLGSAYAQHRATLAKNVTTLVSENGFKFSHLYPDASDVFDVEGRLRDPEWTEVDSAIAFANRRPDRPLSQHVHAFYWSDHPWPAELSSSSAHIRRLAASYATRMEGATSCDVLNEIFLKTDAPHQPWSAAAQGNTNFFQSAVLEPLLRPEIPKDRTGSRLGFLRQVVRIFREELNRRGLGHIELLLNEDQLSWVGPKAQAKRDAVRGFLKHLIDHDTALDGLGIQGHLVAKDPPDIHSTMELIEWLNGKTMTVHLSELDVTKKTNPEFSDDAHAAMVGDFVHAVLQQPNLRRLGFWGLFDAEHFSRKKKKIGERYVEHALYDPQSSPTLFDDDGHPKPVFNRILKELRAVAEP
ncbi:endo-1,4-beta-xylanase [Roseobacter sinensis]|uniref:endo-1,4-beta-xylanase n=1 Tax=Roseobacter sinensis TaxID=2931391 RepID=UPI0021E90BAC|nr:endo-1,4-beta-xylanase [Roseobacter sp. WL0113]